MQLSFKEMQNLFIYVILLGLSVFLNKYVLSVLNFNYPTVFQGWQTLIGGILLKILLSRNCLLSSSVGLDKSGFISLLPSFLFFSAAAVAGSKALAGLSVAMYLSIQNSLKATLYLLEFGQNFYEGALTVIACLVTLASLIAAIVLDLGMTFSDSDHFWMMVAFGCLAVRCLHSKIADARYTETDCLYFSYIFSFVVLAPASLYLEEALQVLKFPHTARYDFYAACLMAGIISTLLNLFVIKIQHEPQFALADALGRLALSGLSLLTFKDASSVHVKMFLSVSQVAALFVKYPSFKGPASEKLDPFLDKEAQNSCL